MIKSNFMAITLLFTRHGAAVQERRSPEALVRLQALPDEAFKHEILAMNMRQGLTAEGRTQASNLGKRLGQLLLPQATEFIALVGPYKRHKETAEIALAAPALRGRAIRVIHDKRLAERSRGRLDASIWPTRALQQLTSDHQYGREHTRKTSHPATWRPPLGENYADVNQRVDAALKAHGIYRGTTPAVVFGSGEMALASLKLSDSQYRQGTTTERGKAMSLLTLNNCGAVILNDPGQTGHPTHWQLQNPAEDGSIISSRMHRYR